MKQAVCILLKRGDKYLGVARRDNHKDFGLPGGKVDDTDLSPQAAIVREVREETGLDINPLTLTKSFDMVCKGGKDGVDYNCITFNCINFKGEPSQGDAGPVRWVTREELNDGSFGDYNKELFKSLEAIE